MAKKESLKEISHTLATLRKNPRLKELSLCAKSLTNSGAWVGYSYLRYFSSFFRFQLPSDSHQDLKAHDFIIEQIAQRKKKALSHLSAEDIFTAIYREQKRSHENASYQSRLKYSSVMTTSTTIALIPGALNEIFSTAAFKRGLEHLSQQSGLNYIIIKVHGTKTIRHNVALIERQLNDYTGQHPHKKLWIIAFSKGGLEALEFLKKNKKSCEKNIIGLSTIAAPILGSNHLDHKIIKLITSVHKFSRLKIYKYLNHKKNLLGKEWQQDLRPNYRKTWFKRNYQNLPQNIFYTALAFSTPWWQGHPWIILAKIFFQSSEVNDGIVEAESAFFPKYFKAYRLGVLRGHHLSGNRSSYYNQEALLEAHIIFLDYLELLNDVSAS